jgi:hypothetical protein
MQTESSTTSLPGQKLKSSSPLGPSQSEGVVREIFELGRAADALVGSRTAPLAGRAASGPAQNPQLFDSSRGQPTDSYPRLPVEAESLSELTATPRKNGSILQTRQLWEGTVTEVLSKGFVAVLADKTNPTNPDEYATFDFENVEISKDDLTLLGPGATFYWIIGREKTSGGTVKNVSIVQFRRVPAWTRSALSAAVERAKSIRALFQTQE